MLRKALMTSTMFWTPRMAEQRDRLFSIAPWGSF